MSGELSRESTPLAPSPALLCKLGSIARHWQEYTSPASSQFDVDALNTLLSDPEVVEWMAAMDRLALLPVRR